MEKQEKQKIDIRVILTGKVKDQFLEIKEAEGLKNGTEVLRHIINEYYRIKNISQLLRGNQHE